MIFFLEETKFLITKLPGISVLTEKRISMYFLIIFKCVYFFILYFPPPPRGLENGITKIFKGEKDSQNG